MTISANTEVASADDRREALVEKIFQSVIGFNAVYMLHIGERLGLYRGLAAGGPSTARELAQRTGTTERYVREWLECQAASGIVEVDDVSADDAQRKFSLPDGHIEVLTDRDHPGFMAAFARMQVGMASPIEQVIEAFRSGAGVGYGAYGVDFCEGQGDMNRVGFINDLASSWIPAIPSLHERLLASPPVRVADVACGVGWSTIALARAYPDIEIIGIDSDERSIELANANAESEPVGDRLTFRCIDAAEISDDRGFDLITVFEAIHDMSDPVTVLGALRGLLAPGGSLLIADERVADNFEAPASDVEQLMYGWSVLHCLPVGMAHQPSVATGTAMRPATMQLYASQAGFSKVEIAPIEHDFWRFYHLLP